MRLKVWPLVICLGLGIGCTEEKEVLVPVTSLPGSPDNPPAPICRPDTSPIPNFSGIEKISQSSNRSILMEWNVVPEAIQYLIFKKSDSQMEVVKVLPAGTGEYLFDDAGFGEHTFRVRAMNDIGLLDENVNNQTIVLENNQTFMNQKALLFTKSKTPIVQVQGVGAKINKQFTISFWMKIDTQKPGVLPISFPGDVGRTSFYVRLDKSKITVGHRRHTGHFASFSSLVNYADSEWHNVVVTYDEKYFSLYFNGVFLGNQQDSFLGVGSGAIEIGSLAGKIGKFVGDLDEVAIWNGSLSADKINEIFGQNHFPDLQESAPPPIAWWRMGDGPADSEKRIFDQSSHFHIHSQKSQKFNFSEN